MGTILIILILVGLWVAVLVPPLLRARHEHRGGNSIGNFSKKLGSLGRTNGQPSGGPASIGTSLSAPLSQRTRPTGSEMTPVQKRRRDVLIGLGGAVAATVLLAFVVGGLAWLLPLVALAALGAYVVMLLQIKQASAERRAKVHRLPTRPAPFAGVTVHEQPTQRVLQRTASSS
ncbi:MAG: hypothetical protein M5U31_06470 [Acidimicrobiia bacterium]|nr:hypothetical protein [Acidimicrobiia bacterium]